MDSDNSPTYHRLGEIAGQPLVARKAQGLNVGIIVPPSPFTVPVGWEFVHKAPFEGPSIIAAVIKGLGHQVSIVDQREKFDPETLKGGALKKFDVISVATYSDNFPYIKRAVQIAKQEAPGRPVVLGGPFVTSLPELIMNQTAADYAVLGEGELTTIELFDFITRDKRAFPLEHIHGLAWKNESGKVVLNPKRTQMRNIDAVPFQDFSVWPIQQKTGEAPEIYMTSSRGCPGNCSFCYRAMPLLRHKSVQRVRRELLYLKKYNYRYVWWSDLTFIDSIDRVHALMDEAFAGIDFRWSCFTRVDGIDLPVLKHMKENGCDIVMYGFESITPKILDYFRKRTDQDQIVRAIMLTRQAGLKIGGLFIVGGPGESVDSLNKLVEFCREFKEVTRVKYMSALPGTKLYRDAIQNGIIKDEIEHLYFMARERSVEDDEILNFTDIPQEEIRKAYRAINNRIEVRPYEYWDEKNRYLKKPEKFKLRGRNENRNSS